MSPRVRQEGYTRWPQGSCLSQTPCNSDIPGSSDIPGLVLTVGRCKVMEEGKEGKEGSFRPSNLRVSTLCGTSGRERQAEFRG